MDSEKNPGFGFGFGYRNNSINEYCMLYTLAFSIPFAGLKIPERGKKITKVTSKGRILL